MLVDAEVRALIDRALAEDVGSGDPTTDLLVPRGMTASGTMVAKGDGVLAGIEVALATFRRLDGSVATRALREDGAGIDKGEPLAEVEGPLGSILKAERVSLNFVQHLSGIATTTAQYLRALEGFGTRLVDARKTLPGLRTLQKYAVRVGGAHNHRQNLADGILIKDNHLEALAREGVGLGEAVRIAREQASHLLRVEVEVESLEQVREAVEAGADVIMLDNMGIDEMREAVRLCNGRALVEASGGIRLERLREVAETGVDLISVGALTHSVQALDVSLEVAWK